MHQTKQSLRHQTECLAADAAFLREILTTLLVLTFSSGVIVFALLQ
jgi:hypothetical protein